MNFNQTGTYKGFLLQTTEDGRILVTFPVNCSPYQGSMPTIIRDRDDAVQLIGHLNEWIAEGELTTEKFRVYSSVIAYIAHSGIME